MVLKLWRFNLTTETCFGNDHWSGQSVSCNQGNRLRLLDEAQGDLFNTCKVSQIIRGLICNIVNFWEKVKLKTTNE
ncbi:hypothetical protein DPMN_065152 [Dreissena polymorpha]|uniref:Uncharacterized protein n=1 Tax=Dreissena polymorpha TaxID=45954 RepID=A0A9D4CEH2_DREPO|nr:hypothetical protein DPMN_065152 [Dreissena polymorpha]